MNKDSKIETYKEALNLLNNYLLVSKPYGMLSSIYAKASDGSILVLNKNSKYYISEDEFKKDFNLSTFYVYKHLSEVEIDQEFHSLRQ